MRLDARRAARGRRVTRRLACGTINVNEGCAATWGSVDAPVGGIKASGLGRRREGLLKYSDPQTVSVQRAARYARALRHIPFLR